MGKVDSDLAEITNLTMLDFTPSVIARRAPVRYAQGMVCAEAIP